MTPSPALHDFVASLVTPHTAPLEQHPWLRALGDASGGALAPMASAIDALRERTWPVTFRHGDLAPWNLLRTADGRLVAVDWEYGSASGLPGLDLAQYVLQVGLLIVRCPPAVALDDAARALQRSIVLDGARLSRRESVALAMLAAFETHHAASREGLTHDDPRQTWRRGVWSARLPHGAAHA
jgi:aminoglycoside phosphotransferase (APT) family kinase protein